jgi:hypothetical protein
MGLLNLFSTADAEVHRLPTGSMTVDRHGNVVTTTISSAYPEVLLLFRESRAAQFPISEFNLQFASLHITAREMRGGAIIFLSVKTPFTTPN